MSGLGLGSFVVQLQHVQCSDVAAFDKAVSGPAVFGFEWWGQRRAIRGKAPSGFALVWQKSVKFKITESTARSLGDIAQVNTLALTLIIYLS
ncbi:hypothetical protein WJX73_004426 [Symbiochloris irregularis]|uniref:Uncharacterized protein n=1 Tax=Symbiochloris irregularis TaxID=706552 RepID=A0AAW1NMD4_9CHLO